MDAVVWGKNGMNKAVLILLLFCSTQLCYVQALNLVFEHDVGDHEFRSAGKIVGALENFGGARQRVELSLERTPLSEDVQKSFWRTVREDGFYRIRVPSNPLDESSPKLIASVKARCLAAAGFDEQLTLFTTESGHIVGLDYKTKQGSCRAAGAPVSPRQRLFSPRVAVHTVVPEESPRLRMETMFQELGQMPESSLRSDVKGNHALPPGAKPPPKAPEDTKTWMQKNWMLVIPLFFVVMNVFANAANPPDPRAAERGPQGVVDTAAAIRGAVEGGPGRGAGRRR